MGTRWSPVVRTDYPPAVHRTILVTDIEGFGNPNRTNRHQVAVRSGHYQVLQRALNTSAIEWNSCYHEDRGDGALILAPPDVPKEHFVDTLPDELVNALLKYNGACGTEERIRLRMALHAGEVRFDEHGVTAASINLAFRLIDARTVKDALASSPGVLALVTSSWFFDEVVRHGVAVSRMAYQPVPIEIKETATTAWICLPDQQPFTEMPNGRHPQPA